MATRLRLGDIEADVVLKEIKNVHLSVYPPSGRVRISAPARMSPRDADRIRPRGSLAVLLATLAMTGGAMLVLLAGPVSMRGYTFTRDFGANLLSRMPPGASLACSCSEALSAGPHIQVRVTSWAYTGLSVRTQVRWKA